MSWLLGPLLVLSSAASSGGASSGSASKCPRGAFRSDCAAFGGATFSCADGGGAVTSSAVNDDYCDCHDGSDEPGTSACSSGRFWCANAGFAERFVPSSRVNDGVCDCCDGADEWSAGAGSAVACRNSCAAKAANANVEIDVRRKIIAEGVTVRKAYAEEGAKSKAKRSAKLAEVQAQLALLTPRLVELEKRYIIFTQREAKLASERAALTGELILSDESEEPEPEAAAGEGAAAAAGGGGAGAATAGGGPSPCALQFGAECQNGGRCAQLKQHPASTSAPRFKCACTRGYKGRVCDRVVPGVLPPPGAPRLLRVASGDGALHVSFAPSKAAEGGPVGMYVVYARSTVDGSFVSVGCDSSPCAVEQLRNGMAYELWMRAQNHVGPSAPSELTPPTRPRAAGEVRGGADGCRVAGQGACGARRWAAQLAARTKVAAKAICGPFAERYLSWLSEPALAFLCEEGDALKVQYVAARQGAEVLTQQAAELQAGLAVDFGPDEAFFPLGKRCVSTTPTADQQYTYSLCGLRQLMQVDPKAHTKTLLGQWEGWAENYTVMELGDGERCWNGPPRKARVRLECAVKDFLKQVNEASKCEYEVVMGSPAACLEALVPQLYGEVGGEEQGAREEL